MDLRSGSEIGGIPTLTAAVREDPGDRIGEQLRTELGRLCGYLMKSARRRVKLVKSGTLAAAESAIAAEMALSAAAGRFDLVENLGNRLATIRNLHSLLEIEDRKDYRKRFGPTAAGD